jgi:DnaJ-domain-containing protein 1
MNMENKKPDNIVYSVEEVTMLMYCHMLHRCACDSVDDLVSWKSRGITNVNKELELKFNELKLQYQQLMEEYEWNELVYSAKFSFEPVIGEIYHLYRIIQNAENK